MKIFQDTTGRTWTITMNIGMAMKVQGKLAVDLLQPEQGNPPLLEKLGSDELFLARVIAILLEDQFDKNEMDDKKIYEAFDGATMIAAQTAFYEELVDFFQSRGRNDRVKAVRKLIKAVQTGIKIAEAKIDAIDIEAEVSGAMSGDSQELSGSTQGN